MQVSSYIIIRFPFELRLGKTFYSLRFIFHIRNICTCCRKNFFLDYFGHRASGSHENDGCEKYLFGISGLGALLVISCIVIACCIRRTRVKPPIAEEIQKTRSEVNNSAAEIYEIPFSRDERDNDLSAFTDLQPPVPGEPNEDHDYAHLNQALSNDQNNVGQTGH